MHVLRTIRLADRAQGHAQRLGRPLAISVPTNATLLDRRAIEAVQRWNLDVSLSLDGAPDAYEARRSVRGLSGWSLIGPRLDQIVDLWRGPLPAVRMTVVPGRAARLMEDVSYLLSRGFRTIAFLPASGVSWTPEATQQLDESMQQVGENLVQRLRRNESDLPRYPHLFRRLAPLYVQAKTGTIPQRRGFC